MKKFYMRTVLFCLLILSLAAPFASAKAAENSAGSETEFTLDFYDHGNGTVDLEICTTQTQGVGGLHIEIYPETAMWAVDSSHTKAFVNKADVTANETRAAFAWDSINGETLPEKLFRTTFHAKTEAYDITQIQVQILDYYDNTLEMNDLPYYFQAPNLISGKAKPLYNIWAILFCMLLIMAAVTGLFLVSRRWRYAALYFIAMCIKKVKFVSKKLNKCK